jgi:dihydrofolate reductase
MLSLIVALADNYAIGKDGDMPWHLPDDLKRFSKITSGKTIIMGRKTFESLPKVLPGRTHIVISSSDSLDSPKADNEMVEIRTDIDNVFKEYASKDTESFIIGGAVIYKQALPYCDKMYLTFVEGDFEADTFFPKFDMSMYVETERSEVLTDSVSGVRFQYITLSRKK